MLFDLYPEGVSMKNKVSVFYIFYRVELVLKQPFLRLHAPSFSLFIYLSLTTLAEWRPPPSPGFSQGRCGFVSNSLDLLPSGCIHEE